MPRNKRRTKFASRRKRGGPVDADMIRRWSEGPDADYIPPYMPVRARAENDSGKVSLAPKAAAARREYWNEVSSMVNAYNLEIEAGRDPRLPADAWIVEFLKAQ